MADLETAVRDGLDQVARLVSMPDDAWAAYRRRASRLEPRHRLRFGLSVAGIAAATAGIVVGAIALTSGSGSGGDLGVSSSSTVTLLSSRHLSPDQLRQAGTVLARRLTDANIRFGRVSVITKHDEQSLKVTAPPRSLAEIATIAQTRGVLQFRQALSEGAGAPDINQSRTNRSRLAESPTLSPSFMRSYQRWNCRHDPNPNHGNDVATDYVIACSAGGSQKYLLAPAAVDGSQVANSSANLDAVSGSQWVVDLAFRKAGAQAWLHVTERAYNVNSGQPQTTGCNPPKGCNTVAIVLDGVVQSAPYISQAGGIAGGSAQISGDFTQRSATQLAAILKAGALPAVFTTR